MRAKSNNGDLSLCPEYVGSAVCVDATPLKTVKTQYGPKEQFQFVFEIAEPKHDGTPWCVWSTPFTRSLHEKSALRPFLTRWMGRELTKKELQTLAPEDFLGRAAHLTVIHEYSNGEIYENIVLIGPDNSPEPLAPSGKFVRVKDRLQADTLTNPGSEPASAIGSGGEACGDVDENLPY